MTNQNVTARGARASSPAWRVRPPKRCNRLLHPGARPAFLVGSFGKFPFRLKSEIYPLRYLPPVLTPFLNWLRLAKSRPPSASVPPLRCPSHLACQMRVHSCPFVVSKWLRLAKMPLGVPSCSCPNLWVALKVLLLPFGFVLQPLHSRHPRDSRALRPSPLASFRKPQTPAALRAYPIRNQAVASPQMLAGWPSNWLRFAESCLSDLALATGGRLRRRKSEICHSRSRP